MLRTFGKTTLLAAALFALANFGPVGVHPAAAQEVEACQQCQAGSGGARACSLCGRLHGPSYNCRPRYYGQPELFYNYYIPGTCGGVPANLYVAPQPVPRSVGHTYYTYQPLMPHELLYQHHRDYYRYYDGGRGLTRTHVSWSRPPFTGWYSNLRIAR